MSTHTKDLFDEAAKLNEPAELRALLIHVITKISEIEALVDKLKKSDKVAP